VRFYTGHVLQDTKRADVPVVQPTKFAKVLGLEWQPGGRGFRTSYGRRKCLALELTFSLQAWRNTVGPTNAGRGPGPTGTGPAARALHPSVNVATSKKEPT
jgi:hypothetical protein